MRFDQLMLESDMAQKSIPMADLGKEIYGKELTRRGIKIGAKVVYDADESVDGDPWPWVSKIDVRAIKLVDQGEFTVTAISKPDVSGKRSVQVSHPELTIPIDVWPHEIESYPHYLQRVLVVPLKDKRAIVKRIQATQTVAGYTANIVRHNQVPLILKCLKEVYPMHWAWFEKELGLTK